MIVVGLTGKTGQGKSTLGAMLRELAGVDRKADLESSYPISEVANDWLATWPHELALGTHGNVAELANQLIETLPAIIKRRTGKATTYAGLRIGLSPASLKLNQRLIDYLETWLRLGTTERHVQLPLPIKPDNKGLHRALLQWIGGTLIETVSPTIWSDLIDQRIKNLASRGYKLVTVGGIRYSHDAEMIHANGGVIVGVVRPEQELAADAAIKADITETSMDQFIADIEVVNDGTLEQLDTLAAELYNDLEKSTAKPKYIASQK